MKRYLFVGGHADGQWLEVPDRYSVFTGVEPLAAWWVRERSVLEPLLSVEEFKRMALVSAATMRMTQYLRQCWGTASETRYIYASAELGYMQVFDRLSTVYSTQRTENIATGAT